MTWEDDFDLTYLRSINARHPYHFNPSAYRRLSPEVVIKRSRYAELAPWDQDKARIAAHARSATKAVLCSRSASRAHGLAVLGHGHQVELSYIGGTRPKRRSQWPPGVQFRHRYLSAAETTVLHGMRVTGLARTLQDLVVIHGLVEGVLALDSALRNSTISPATLESMVLTGPPFHGKPRVRRAVELMDPDSGSPLESLARMRLVTAEIPGLATIVSQAEVSVGGRTYRVDFLINGFLVVEVDGMTKYDGSYGQSTQVALTLERRREVDLLNQGFPVLRLVAADLTLRPDGSCRAVELVTDALATWARPAR